VIHKNLSYRRGAGPSATAELLVYHVIEYFDNIWRIDRKSVIIPRMRRSTGTFCPHRSQIFAFLRFLVCCRSFSYDFVCIKIVVVTPPEKNWKAGFSLKVLRLESPERWFWFHWSWKVLENGSPWCCQSQHVTVRLVHML